MPRGRKGHTPPPVFPKVMHAKHQFFGLVLNFQLELRR